MNQNVSRTDFESSLIAKAWKDEVFKQELVNNPKAVIEKELEQKLSSSVKIQVLEENSDTLYLVIPQAPQVSEELSEEALESVAGGRGFIYIQPGPGGPYLVYSDQ
jgi:hypothetical protein